MGMLLGTRAIPLLPAFAEEFGAIRKKITSKRLLMYDGEQRQCAPVLKISATAYLKRTNTSTRNSENQYV